MKGRMMIFATLQMLQTYLICDMKMMLGAKHMSTNYTLDVNLQNCQCVILMYHLYIEKFCSTLDLRHMACVHLWLALRELGLILVSQFPFK